MTDPRRTVSLGASVSPSWTSIVFGEVMREEYFFAVERELGSRGCASKDFVRFCTVIQIGIRA